MMEQIKYLNYWFCNKAHELKFTVSIKLKN